MGRRRTVAHAGGDPTRRRRSTTRIRCVMHLDIAPASGIIALWSIASRFVMAG